MKSGYKTQRGELLSRLEHGRLPSGSWMIEGFRLDPVMQTDSLGRHKWWFVVDDDEVITVHYSFDEALEDVAGRI